LGVSVPEGALFYGRERRRTRVQFDEDLRRKTEQTALDLHEMVASGRTPPPEYGKKCKSCSLQDACLPKVCSANRSVSKYLSSALEEK
jgi:CRISPR-associated exonuclease Cas4